MPAGAVRSPASPPDRVQTLGTPALPAANHLWTYREFRHFWLARFATMLAQSCAVLAIGWQVYDVSRLSMGIRAASFRLGMIGLAQFLPLLACTLISGWLADRIDRRRIAAGAVALQLFCVLALGVLAWCRSQQLPAYFVLAAGLGVVRAFYMPAMTAIAPNLVPSAVLPRALAANAVAGRAGAIVGPMAGGFAYAVAPWCAFALSASLLAVSLASLASMRPVADHLGRTRDGPLAEIAAGFRYIRANRTLFGVITLDLVACLLGGITALLPVFARDILKIGPQGLGLLRAAPAAGALSSALLLTLMPLRLRGGPVMLVAVAVYGAATVGFGLSHWLAVSLACLYVLGVSDMISVYIRQSIVQLATPNAMRGRVSAIGTLSVSASNELGEMESGIVASLLGPVGAVVAGGVGAIAAVAVWSRLFPELRVYDLPRAELPAEDRDQTQ